MANSPEARALAYNACRKRRLHRFPEQRLTGELASRLVDRACLHRLPGSFEHQRHGLEHRARLGGSRARFTRIGLGFAEQLVVERADPRELNLGLRVRTCPV